VDNKSSTSLIFLFCFFQRCMYICV